MRRLGSGRIAPKPQLDFLFAAKKTRAKHNDDGKRLLFLKRLKIEQEFLMPFLHWKSLASCVLWERTVLTRLREADDKKRRVRKTRAGFCTLTQAVFPVTREKDRLSLCKSARLLKKRIYQMNAIKNGRHLLWKDLSVSSGLTLCDAAPAAESLTMQYTVQSLIHWSLAHMDERSTDCTRYGDWIFQSSWQSLHN